MGVVVVTKRILVNALARDGNISRIAEMLGVTRRTVQRAIKRYGLANPLGRKVHVAAMESETPEIFNTLPHIFDVKEIQPFRVDLSAFSGHCVGDVGRRRH